MKLQIIKEESVYRIQELIQPVLFKRFRHDYWKTLIRGVSDSLVYYKEIPRDFTTTEEAEAYIVHNYVVKVIKEFTVE